MALETGSDDLVSAIVERTTQVQQRLMSEYFADALAAMRRETEALIRAEFGGETAYAGKVSKMIATDRNSAIKADRVAGLSIRQLSRKYHLSKTHVLRLLA